MKNIVAIGASNSRNSINRRFATYVAGQVEGATVTVADLNDFVLPLYSPDLEKEAGLPENVHRFDEVLEVADGIVLSLAEYNGSYTAAFKNLFDWLSRKGRKVWKDKPMLLMAASPGGRGGANVLNSTKFLMPHFGGNVIADFSLPRFHQNFTADGIIDPKLKEDLAQKIELFQQAL